MESFTDTVLRLWRLGLAIGEIAQRCRTTPGSVRHVLVTSRELPGDYPCIRPRPEERW